MMTTMTMMATMMTIIMTMNDDEDGNSYDAGVVRRVERDNLLSELNQL